MRKISASLARTVLVGALVLVGLVATVATAPPRVGARGESDEQAIVITATEPEVAISGAARLVFESPASANQGSIKLILTPHEGSAGSVAVAFDGASDSATDEFFGEISDPVTIESFDPCVDECVETFTITFTRTDDLESDFSFSWQLVGFANASAQTTGTIEYTFD